MVYFKKISPTVQFFHRCHHSIRTVNTVQGRSHGGARVGTRPPTLSRTTHQIFPNPLSFCFGCVYGGGGGGVPSRILPVDVLASEENERQFSEKKITISKNRSVLSRFGLPLFLFLSSYVSTVFLCFKKLLHNFNN